MVELGELVERFKQSGHGETAELLGQDRGQQALYRGPTRAGDWAGGAGHSRESKQAYRRNELVARLCRELPDAVDKYTAQGRLPSEADFSRA